MGFTPNWTQKLAALSSVPRPSGRRNGTGPFFNHQLLCLFISTTDDLPAVQVAPWAVNSGEWSQSNTYLPWQAALRVYCCGITDRCSQRDEFWSSYNISKIKCTVEQQNSLWKSKQRNKTKTKSLSFASLFFALNMSFFFFFLKCISDPPHLSCGKNFKFVYYTSVSLLSKRLLNKVWADNSNLRRKYLLKLFSFVTSSLCAVLVNVPSPPPSPQTICACREYLIIRTSSALKVCQMYRQKRGTARTHHKSLSVIYMEIRTRPGLRHIERKWNLGADLRFHFFWFW